MYTITNLIMQAMTNTQSFRRIGQVWYAGVSESQYTVLDKSEGFCLEYMHSLGLLKQKDSFYEIFSCTKELMNLNLKVGMKLSYSSYNPKTSRYSGEPLKLASGYKAYLL